MSTTTRRNRLSKLARQPELGGRVRAVHEGALPCRSCGLVVALPDPETVETLTVYGQQAPGLANSGHPRPSVEVSVTRCEKCSTRRARAELIVTFLRIGSIPGTGEIEVERLDAALAAIDMLDARRDLAADRTHTVKDERELIVALAPIGAAASWTALVAAGLNAASVGSTRWAFVPDELRQAASIAHRDLVRHSLESVAACPPPEVDDALRGCLLCGRSTLRSKPSDAAAAWGPLVTVWPGELGGARRPAPVAGYLCPDDRRIVAEVGAPGMPAVERALLQFLGYSLAAGSVFTRPLGRAWAALPDGTPPNDHPWDHVKLAKLRHDLDRAPRVHKVPETGWGRPA